MDNAANRKSIRRKEKAARLADVQRREVITQTMQSAAGRQWVWDRLSDCMVFSSTFNGDALQSAFNEGLRAAGLAMLSDIMAACPDLYIQAQRESNERRTTDERRSSAESDGGDTGPTETPSNYGDFDNNASRDDDLYGDGYSRDDH